MIGIGIGLVTVFIIGMLIAMFTVVGVAVNKPILTLAMLIIAIAMGIGSWHPLINWIINSKIGDYRIIICQRRKDDTITLATPMEPKIVVF